MLHSPLPLRLMMQPPCEAPPSSDPHSHQTNDCYRFFKKSEEGRDAACAMATITSPLAVGRKVFDNKAAAVI